MPTSYQKRPLTPIVTSALIIIAFIVVGLGYILLAYMFGVGTGLFGVKNIWDSEDTIFLISGIALIASAISNPIRNKYTVGTATIILILTGSVQSDRAAISLVLLLVLWFFYYLRNRSLRSVAAN